MEPQSPPEQISDIEEWFKQGSLAALKRALQVNHYPDYPTERIWLPTDNPTVAYSDTIPSGPWEYNNAPLPTQDEQESFLAQGYALDSLGRPQHPWLDDMFLDAAIGVITGKGFYWKWGPNQTVDPIVIRHDLSEPHVLLIERDDGTGWALPGGFQEADETKLEGAVREGREESRVDPTLLAHKATLIYEGPLADLRVTAHAWPETTAYRLDLLLDSRQDRKLLENMMSSNRRQRLLRMLGRFAFTERINQRPWKGRDDARNAAWVPVSQLDDKLFGSHKLLIELALRQEQPLS